MTREQTIILPVFCLEGLKQITKTYQRRKIIKEPIITRDGLATPAVRLIPKLFHIETWTVKQDRNRFRSFGYAALGANFKNHPSKSL